MPTKTKKLLFVAAISPIPKSSGGAVRIYNTIKELSRHFRLHLVIFKDPAFVPAKDDLAFLKKHSQTHVFFDTNPNKTEQAFLDFHQPYWFSDWYNPEAIIGINQIIRRHRIRLAHIELTQLLYLSDYLPRRLYKIFVAEDISTVSIKRRLGDIKDLNVLIRITHFQRWLEVFFYEKKYLPKFDLVASVSVTDEKILKTSFHLQNTIVIPNGIETINFLNHPLPQNLVRLGYFGSFSHPPNRYAFIYFVNKIAPLLENNKINYQFYLAGKNDPSEIKRLIDKSKLINKKSIIDLGFVPKVTDFYQHVDILVTPISSGSGSRIKILESLGLGIPVVSTPVGAEGNELRTPYLKTASNETEFVSQILLTRQQLLDSTLKNQRVALKTLIQGQLWSSIFNTYAKTLINKLK